MSLKSNCLVSFQKESECVWCMRVLKVAAGGNFGRREGSIKRGVSERQARGVNTQDTPCGFGGCDMQRARGDD